jgi:hypothetical protein
MSDDTQYDPTLFSFVSFLDERGNQVEGYFKIIWSNGLLFKLQGRNTILTIPATRILKIREKLNAEEEKSE